MSAGEDATGLSAMTESGGAVANQSGATMQGTATDGIFVVAYATADNAGRVVGE